MALPGTGRSQDARLQGRVLMGPDSVPVAGAEVALHRIGRDTGAVVTRDSADVDGRFAIRLPPADSGDLFLVTARYQGVLYFGPPFHQLSGAPDPYPVVVYPSRPLGRSSTLPLTRRHLVVTPSDGGLDVLDVASVANDSAWTVTAARTGEPVWSLAVPRGARGVAVGRGGVSAGEVALTDGRAAVRAAVPPGGQRLVLRYQLPAGEAVELPVGRPVAVLEMLVRPPGRVERASGLQDAGTVRFEGEEFRRYRAGDVRSGTTIRFAVSTAASGGSASILPWALAGAGVLLLAAAVLVRRRLRDAT